MRITDTNRLNRAGAKKTKKAGQADGQSFTVSDEADEARAASITTPMADVGGIDALLTLQAVEDPTFAKKKIIKRGQSLLDGLDRIKTDLLVGHVSEARLENMLVQVKQAQQKGDSELGQIIDEIELRVRVELAKFGKF